MIGKLYGIGTGPGDPELITLKAIHTLKNCDIIAYPSTSDGEKTAYSIVKPYIAGKELLECRFSMERDEQKRKAKRNEVANDICKLLSKGKTVGFITLGDPTIYSTYMYVHHHVKENGFSTEIISGVPSFVAVAAVLDKSLCEGNELLHIIPATNEENIACLSDLNGNKVIMKSGKNMNKVLETLKHKDASVQIVERCSMDGQKIYRSIKEYEAEENPHYFSVIVVKE